MANLVKTITTLAKIHFLLQRKLRLFPYLVVKSEVLEYIASYMASMQFEVESSIDSLSALTASPLTASLLPHSKIY